MSPAFVPPGNASDFEPVSFSPFAIARPFAVVNPVQVEPGGSQLFYSLALSATIRAVKFFPQFG
jgi:hypothetical protein